MSSPTPLELELYLRRTDPALFPDPSRPHAPEIVINRCVECDGLAETPATVEGRLCLRRGGP